MQELKSRKTLGQVFCYLQMDYVLGINSTWTSTTDNYVADDISRLRKLFLKIISTMCVRLLILATEISRAEELSFLSALTRLALDPMGHSVAGEVTKSQASQGLETVRARQAHFIKWCYAKHIIDPVGP